MYYLTVTTTVNFDTAMQTLKQQQLQLPVPQLLMLLAKLGWKEMVTGFHGQIHFCLLLILWTASYTQGGSDIILFHIYAS